MWKNLSIVQKLSGITLAIVFVSFLTASLSSTSISDTAIRQGAQEAATALTRGEASKIQKSFSEVFWVSESLSRSLGVLKEQDIDITRQAVNELLSATVLQKSELVVGMGTLWEPNAFDGKDAEFRNAQGHDETGRFIPYWFKTSASTTDVAPALGYDAPDADWYSTPITRGVNALTDPYPYPVNGEEVLVVTVSVPIFVDGRAVGIIGADFPLSQLQENLGRVKPLGSGYLTLISSSGTIVAGPDASVFGLPANLEADAAGAVANGQSLAYSDDTFAHFIEPLEFAEGIAPWSLQMSIPIDAATAAADQVFLVSAGIGGGSLIIIAIALVFAIRWQLKPLTTVAGVLDGLKGDLTTRAPITANDEVGQIAKSINHFLARIETLIIDIKTETGSVIDASRSVLDITQTVSARSSNQVDAAGSAATAVEQVTVSIDQIADGANHADGSARGCNDLIGDSVGRVQNAAKLNTQVSTSMGGVRVKVESLDKNAKEIDGITDVIHGIAEQTNLLALNAAIEAARAGEQGRGFAVVADEVRSLASRTGEATTEISQLLQGIQGESQALVTDVEAAVTQVDLGVEETNAAAKAIEQIRQQIAEVTEQTTTIATATNQQSSASKEVAGHVVSISESALENQGAVEQVHSELQRMDQMLANLGKQVAYFTTK